MEFTLPYVSPSEKSRAFRLPVNNDTDTEHSDSNFDDAMLSNKVDDPQPGQQVVAQDHSAPVKHEIEVRPEVEVPEGDVETTAEKAKRIEIELFVGQMLKQIEFPEQSAIAVKALTGTLAEFIQEAMAKGGVEGVQQEAGATIGDQVIPRPFQSSEIVTTLAQAQTTAISSGSGEVTQTQTPAPIPMPMAAAPSADLPIGDIEITADADAALIPKTSPVVDPHVQTPLKSMAAATGLAPDRQQLEVVAVDTPREIREGDRQQFSTQRSEAVAPDLSRMQRVNNVAGISQHHTGILIADSGNKTYEIRFASSELGQIRVELSMDGTKPEASVLYNNADAEKPLRDLFGPLQSRLASLGIENLSLRHEGDRNLGGEDWPGNPELANEGAAEGMTDASEITYYIAPKRIDAGRLDIRF